MTTAIATERAPKSLRNAPRLAASAPVHVYRILFSPLLQALFGPACRFEPSCSMYAHEAIRLHGVAAGGWLALWRLLRCNPLGPFGWDPVPTPQTRTANFPRPQSEVRKKKAWTLES